MAGFTRRFGNFPGIETITTIEGVNIVDLPAPASIAGVSTGVVAVVGEFADMTYATAVSSTGVVTTRAQPVEVFTAQDMADKVGGWDSTLGNFGAASGNGFAAIRNKTFARLVCVPVNLASSAAGRAWRELPTNAGGAVATPVVTMQGGTVAAGREFRSGTNRVRLAKRAVFTALGHYFNNLDGSTATAASAVTQVLTSALGGFLTANGGSPVPKGAIVVLGQIGGAGALGTNAGTYRVQAAATVDTTLTLERLDGASFVLTTGASQPFRIHPQTDADTGGIGGVASNLADTSGYNLPARPLDASIAAATSLTPTVVPTANAAGSWDSLSGLTLRSHVSTGFVYVATTQAPNAVNDATIDALYVTAIDSLLGDAAPSRDVNILVAARISTAINAYVRTHVLAASAVGVGRIGIISPLLTTLSLATAVSTAGVNRAERIIYSWPGANTFIPEAAGVSLAGSDGILTTTGNLDQPSSVWLAAVLSNLAPERNPGQAASPIPEVLSPITGIQRGVSVLGLNEYAALRAAGVCALRLDRASGPIFQSGITSSLTSGQTNINRRRMADFLQDSLALALTSFSKLPLTISLKDAITGEVDAFLNGLKSPSNPAAQRIVNYQVDDKSGNTPELLARGVYVVIVRVQTLSTADFIVLQTEVGEGVKITTN
jgi:hypothetical protein